MAALTPMVISRQGGGTVMATAPLVAADAAGDTFPAGYQTILRVRNANAAACTVTITPPPGGGPSGTTVAPLPLGPVPATSGDRGWGPFPAQPFADSNGNVNVSYSLSPPTSVTVGVYTLSTT
jgi:hypothetical protein